MIVRDATTQRTISGISIRDAANVLQTIQKAQVRTATGLKTVFENFGDGAGVSVSPLEVNGYGYSKTLITVSTDYTGVTVTGGTPPYTYLWTKITGDANWSIAAPTNPNTFFRRSGVSQGTSWSASFHCTVTDSIGQISVSDTVAANVENTYGA